MSVAGRRDSPGPGEILLSPVRRIARPGSALLACSGTTCETPVPMNTRDYNRFVRWCGSSSQAVTIPAGQSTGVVV